MKFLDLLARLVCAGVLATWCMVGADACVRSGWSYFSVWHHFAGALALYTMAGALLGLLTACLIWLEWRVLGERLASGNRALAVRSACYGVLGALASMNTAFHTFSGEHVARTFARRVGPVAFMFAAFAASALGAALLQYALCLSNGKRARILALIVACFAGLGAFVVWVDLTQYVSLYARIHTILELSAALILGAAFALIFEQITRHFQHGKGIVRVLGALGTGWLVLFICVSAIRVRVDDWLRHVWLEEAYVGRVLRREQIAEAFFKDPFHWRGLYLSRVERMRERFPLGSAKTGPEWLNPPPEEPEFKARIDALRASIQDLNVIVYYVDTLRNDVARDGSVMPNLARFAQTSLDFRRAYATGSDTLRSLPAITGGNYDVSSTPENDLLRVAARAGYHRELLIAKSAREFLGKLRPEFHFDRTVEVPDYPAEMQVWGYGAQQTTAGPLVDRAIEFLGAHSHTQKPFLLWLFNFDQHNWHELDQRYVEHTAEAHHLPIGAGQGAWRYRAIAAGVDAEFGRLVRELTRRKLMDNTVVLFVSDHGEALGHDGFWVHSVFLWEQLVRVPLILHVPGLGGRQVEDRVSLVDIAPTVARFMQPNPSLLGYQGEDLLGYVLPDRPPRRLPLLLTAASKDILVRVGVVDPVRGWKAVLALEAALPELYQLGAPDPDAENLAEAQPKTTLGLLRQLFHSPVFPRTAEDFEVRDTKEQKARSVSESKN